MKTLYIDIDETITDVLKKFSALKGSKILLVIPKKAFLFKNPINLKLLKQKAEEEEKDVQIFSNDPKGKEMVKAVGMKLYEGHLKKRKNLKSAQIRSLPKGKPTQQGKRVSITEVSEKVRKSTQSNVSSPQKKRKKKDEREWVTLFLLNTLKKKTILAFSGLTLLFFFLVMYVAIPSATLYLTPASNILEATVNVTFANSEVHPELFRNPTSHSIDVFPLDLTFQREILYESSGRVFTGSSSRCNIKIVNQRTSPWVLVSKTRFKDNTGVIFRLRDDVEVPAARFKIVKDEDGNASREKFPGTLMVSVVADEKDENGNIIGARGNLEADTRFFLPGLSQFNQSLLYGVNETPCLGGVTEYYTIVTAEDLEASQEKIKDELEAAARQYLVDFVDGENLRRAENDPDLLESISQMILFDNPSAIQYEVLETRIPENLEGKELDSFSVFGEMRVRGIAYEGQRFFELLEQGLLSRVHPEKVLSRIDFESATQHIVYSDSNLEDLDKIKVSVTVRGIEEFNFDPRSDEGKEIIDRILDYVPGKPKIDAHYFITNLEQIQNVHLSIWPFWKNDLPTRRSSITIKVQ